MCCSEEEGLLGRPLRHGKGPKEPHRACRSIRNLGLSPAYLGTWVTSALLLLLWSNKCQARWLDHYPSQYGTNPAPTAASWSLSIERIGIGSVPLLLLFVLLRCTLLPSCNAWKQREPKVGRWGQILESETIPQWGWNSYLRKEGELREGFMTRPGTRQGKTLMWTNQSRRFSCFSQPEPWELNDCAATAHPKMCPCEGDLCDDVVNMSVLLGKSHWRARLSCCSYCTEWTQWWSPTQSTSNAWMCNYPVFTRLQVLTLGGVMGW